MWTVKYLQLTFNLAHFNGLFSDAKICNKVQSLKAQWNSDKWKHDFCLKWSAPNWPIYTLGYFLWWALPQLLQHFSKKLTKIIVQNNLLWPNIIWGSNLQAKSINFVRTNPHFSVTTGYWDSFSHPHSYCLRLLRTVKKEVVVTKSW